mmetsp:Transcript_110231/g.237266  ORF Transcript_110231/g.237266 Transcript_110231/m.237266 type:complete len:160 (+) Transcript_110231:243-722(+)
MRAELCGSRAAAGDRATLGATADSCSTPLARSWGALAASPPGHPRPSYAQHQAFFSSAQLRSQVSNATEQSNWQGIVVVVVAAAVVVGLRWQPRPSFRQHQACFAADHSLRQFARASWHLKGHGVVADGTHPTPAVSQHHAFLLSDQSCRQVARPAAQS